MSDRFLRRTYRILESTVASEYSALSATNKEVYKIIASCGVVNLADGSATKTRLWAMFGEGTTTRTNLEGLLPLPPEEE